MRNFYPRIPQSVILRGCDFVDSLHSCHAEQKRSAGRGGVEPPRVCLRCYNCRHIFGHNLVANGVLKRSRSHRRCLRLWGPSTPFGSRLSALRMTVGKKVTSSERSEANAERVEGTHARSRLDEPLKAFSPWTTRIGSTLSPASVRRRVHQGAVKKSHTTSLLPADVASFDSARLTPRSVQDDNEGRSS